MKKSTKYVLGASATAAVAAMIYLLTRKKTLTVANVFPQGTYNAPPLVPIDAVSPAKQQDVYRDMSAGVQRPDTRLSTALPTPKTFPKAGVTSPGVPARASGPVVRRFG